MYWNGGCWLDGELLAKDRSFSLSFLKLRAAAAAARNRIQYSNRGARSRNDSSRMCIYMYIPIYRIYVVGESTWYYEREEESRNRKRFTTYTYLTSHFTYRPVSRVEEARRETDGDRARYLSIPDRVSATINTQTRSPIVRS